MFLNEFSVSSNPLKENYILLSSRLVLQKAIVLNYCFEFCKKKSAEICTLLLSMYLHSILLTLKDKILLYGPSQKKVYQPLVCIQGK